MEKLNLTNIINSDELNNAIENYCNNIDDEINRDNTRWRFIFRSENLGYLCERCSISVNVYVCSYKDITPNYDKLLPLALNYSDENINLIKIVSKYTKTAIIDNCGRVYFDLEPYSNSNNDKLMHLKYDLEDYWKTHPLCSNKVDKYRRIVVKALDAEIYK